MLELEHREHHLYQMIRFICEKHGECTASRETLARTIGLSPKSLRVMTKALQNLEEAGLIGIEKRDHAPHAITLTDLHQVIYDTILLDRFSNALDARETERMLGEDQVTGPRASDVKTIGDIEATFSEGDFDVGGEEKSKEGAKGEEL